MIGQQNNTQKFALFFLGSLLTLQAVQGRRFLRGHNANNIPHANCAPIEDTDPQYNTKAFVLLKMNGSPTAPTPTKDDATAISRSFSNTYDSMVSCSQKGALREAKTAYLLTDAIERHEPDFDVDFPRGYFTWLLEVDLRCNACGDEDWQLFNDTSTNHHHRPSPSNTCICPGPNQTDFLQAFQQAFLEVSLFNELSVWNASIVNATQIPLLYPYECDSSRDTTYNYDGVCPGHSERQFDFLFSEAPSQSPTDSPTDSPTQFPTDSPTDRPSSKCEPGMIGCPDKHGCIAGAGERYCEARNTCVMWNEPCASDPTPEPTRNPTPSPTKAPSCKPGMVGCNDSNGCNAGAGERYCAATDSCVMWNEDCSSDSGATAPDPVEDPTDAPVAVVTAAPTNAPTQAPVEPIAVTAAPTNIPVTNAPTEAPFVVTPAPTNVPITDAPTQAPVEPVTDAPVAATGTDDVPQE